MELTALKQGYAVEFKTSIWSDTKEIGTIEKIYISKKYPKESYAIVKNVNGYIYELSNNHVSNLILNILDGVSPYYLSQAFSNKSFESSFIESLHNTPFYNKELVKEEV